MQYRGARLDRSVAEFHRAVDLLAADTVPETYWRRLQQSRQARRQRPAQQPEEVRPLAPAPAPSGQALLL